MNKYNKGRAKEYRIKHELENANWVVLRSAGSHGFADLVAINQELRVIKFIQCKAGEFSEKAKEKLDDYYAWVNSVFRCEFEVM